MFVTLSPNLTASQNRTFHRDAVAASCCGGRRIAVSMASRSTIFKVCKIVVRPPGEETKTLRAAIAAGSAAAGRS